MGRHLISIFVLFFCPFSLACENHLDPKTQTSIGVLAEDFDGRPILGLSPFIGLMHEDLLRILVKRHDIKSVVWLGEARHFSEHRQPRITVANETSGFYAHDRHHDGRTFSISNNVDKIPEYWRDARFRGHHYSVLARPHLDGPLILYSANLRHEVRATLQFVSSMISVITNPTRTRETDSILLHQINSSSRLRILILVWLKDHLISNDRLKPEDSAQLEKLIEALQNTVTDVSELQKINFDMLSMELAKLTQLAEGTDEETEFYVGHSTGDH